MWGNTDTNVYEHPDEGVRDGVDELALDTKFAEFNISVRTG